MKKVKNKIVFISFLPAFFLFVNCSGGSKSKTPISGGGEVVKSGLKMNLEFTRIENPSWDPFQVTVHLEKDGSPLPGQTLTLNIPSGQVSAVTDLGDGTYTFNVTTIGSGIYPVEVTFDTVTVHRDAIVANEYAPGVGQPLLVPGLVNSQGYEDGVTITPDGQYLFVQYGPIYFSGLFLVSSICSSPSFSLYDLMGCTFKSDAGWVFNTIGPVALPERPDFPMGAINNGKLTHLNITVPNIANGIALFPTVFYGFKKQADGTFAEPFKVAFNDSKGANGPFGLSFQMTSPTTANFAVAWNNYFNDLGDGDYADIYSGTLTLGQNHNLGDVVYNGELFQSINPHITPVSFTSHAGVQGNPHLYTDNAGVIQSIWTDDETLTHDLSVYKITSGTFPSGTWDQINLPSKINTAASESQPFFTGTRLYLTRDTKIVYHEYVGAGHNDYNLNSSWGDEVKVIVAGNTGVGKIFGFGEPTLATVGGKTYLYFAVVKTRANGAVGGRYDYDLDAGFVEVP